MTKDTTESEDLIKSVRVSEETHQELSVRRYGDESFDDVLKRVLGLVPRTIEELTSPLPSRLATATNKIVTEHMDNQVEFKRIYSESNGNQVLQFISPLTDRVIYDVTVYYPDRPKRVNHRVDIRYRNPDNTLEQIARFRDIKDGAVDIKYTDFETRKTKENTRKGDTPGEATAELVGEHVSKFVELALDRWSGTTA